MLKHRQIAEQRHKEDVDIEELKKLKNFSAFFEHQMAKSVKNPYSVLGIVDTATNEEVKKAYRRLAMKFHPDKVEGLGDEVKKNAEQQFREINEAYETIKKAKNKGDSLAVILNQNKFTLPVLSEVNGILRITETREFYEE